MSNKIRGILLVSLLFMLLLPAFTMAGENDINIKVNGQQLASDVPQQVVDGRIMVPLRATVEALGAGANWSGETQTITITRGDKTIELTIAKPTALINKNPVIMDVPAIIINGRTMVPLRFISESLGASIQWDPVTRTVTIELGEAKGGSSPGGSTPIGNSSASSFLKLNHSYLCPENQMTITVKSINVIDKGGFYEYEINYVERNDNKDKVAEPGLFKAYFKNAEPKPQTGFFNNLYPGEQNSGTFTFKALKTEEPYCIEYGDSKQVFFRKEPAAVSFKWKLSR